MKVLTISKQEIEEGIIGLLDSDSVYNYVNQQLVDNGFDLSEPIAEVDEFDTMTTVFWQDDRIWRDGEVCDQIDLTAKGFHHG